MNPTQTNETLMSLAAIAEEATGPDRPLGAKIALALLPQFAGWIEHPANNGNQYGEMAPSREAFDEWLIRDGPPCLQAAPDFTASLDAAMTLADDEQITELLQEAIERLGQAGWMPGTYKQRLAQFFTASALKARAHSERTGCD